MEQHWDRLDFNKTSAGCLQVTHVCLFFLFKLNTNPPPEAVSAPLSCLGHGKCTCWFAREIIAQEQTDLRFLMHFAFILNILVLQSAPGFYAARLGPSISTESFLWVRIYALPGHICILYITFPGCKQSPPERQLQTVAEHKKPLILIFPPVDESILPGRRTSVGFYEPVMAALRDVSARLYLFLCGRWWRLGSVTLIDRHTIINVHEPSACDQQHIELAFLSR